jgi:NAD(P)-dependent dehydrogenase (short-subunit alcohol dehydrogenase family)
MDLNLSGKTAVITGASQGIGRAVAESLASEGCSLHLVSRTRADLEEAAKNLKEKYPVDVTIHAVDLSVSGTPKALVQETGTPDLLINNAGAIPAGTLDDVHEQKWREAWDLKVFGYINMCRTYFDAMRKVQDGVIVNVTGLAADRTDVNYIAGTAGNASLNAFSKTLGSQSLKDGIRVLAVSPGAVATDRLVTLMKARSQAEHNTPDKWQGYLANLPLSRAAEATEVANVITFMASPRASYMSGTVITVDGGHGANNGSFT